MKATMNLETHDTTLNDNEWNAYTAGKHGGKRLSDKGLRKAHKAMRKRMSNGKRTNFVESAN